VAPISSRTLKALFSNLYAVLPYKFLFGKKLLDQVWLFTSVILASKGKNKLCVVVHAYIPATQETEVGG
jgi:hypothetical protein